MFQHLEPFDGWLFIYSHDQDERSPFHEVEHNLFAYDRRIYTFDAHPLWDNIESESLLVKILYAQYDEGYAILELLGEWNDLHENDFRLLWDNCLHPLVTEGIYRFILICENVFNIYPDADDYYQNAQEELAEGEGWLCLLRARPQVLEELEAYGIGQYFFYSPLLESLRWRKLKPWQVYAQVRDQLEGRLLPGS
ncbi:MAG: hypothetical protein KF690_01280 [Bacteroidetes bacterium]|nr:hypothetical protein [Bacteroidota bacterium]